MSTDPIHGILSAAVVALWVAWRRERAERAKERKESAEAMERLANKSIDALSCEDERT